MFLIWKQSKISKIEVIVLVVLIALPTWIAVVQYSAWERRSYDAGVRVDLKNAARAQEAYFKEKVPIQIPLATCRKLFQVPSQADVEPHVDSRWDQNQL